jgi:hypothetical protein
MRSRFNLFRKSDEASGRAPVASFGTFLGGLGVGSMLAFYLDPRLGRRFLLTRGPGAISLDNPVGIFNQLPAAFDQHCNHQAAGPGQARIIVATCA